MKPAGIVSSVSPKDSEGRQRGGSHVAVALVVVSLFLGWTSRAEESSPGATHALLINGGSKPAVNYQSHLHHLQDMVKLLEKRGLPKERIHIFSADGEDDAPDLAVRGLPVSGFWLIEGTRTGRLLRPATEVTDTRWEGVALHPARGDALREWFKAARKQLPAGDRLLIFVTDHGTINRENLDNGAISLWEEELTVEELGKLVARLRPGVRAVMVMSQCYSGTFSNVIYRTGSSEPSGEVCGFFSTTRDLRAYGCFPEGRDRDRMGHAFHFIDALDHHATTAGAHLEVLVTDDTPDVPLRTSDLYLERIVSEEAEAHGVEVEALVDGLLAEAWLDRAAWEEEIRLLDRIGDAFGTFSPRSLAEVETYESELPPLIERMKTLAKRWKTTLTAVKEENLGSLLSERSEWQDRLQEQTLKDLDAEGRKALLMELLPQLRSHARGQTELWGRIEVLREGLKHADRSDEQSCRAPHS